MRQIHREILENGLTLIVVEDHHLPIVSQTIWYRVGARDETEGQTGLAHFLEHMMFKGTERFPKSSLDDICLRLGGQNNAFTSYDYTAYFFTFASDRWEIALDIEADRMRNLQLVPAEFRAEQQVVLEELKMGEDNPWEFLRKNVRSLAYQRHPYRHPIIGWREDVENLTPAAMEAFYRRHYNLANAILVVGGDVCPESVRELVLARFSGEPAAPALALELAPDSPLEGQLRFQASRPVNVSRLIAAFQAPSARQEDIYAAHLLNYILAEGKTSRLYRRLVEKDQTVSSLSVSLEDMRDPSLFKVAAQLKSGVGFAEVEDALFDEIGRLSREGVTIAEFDKALRQLEADTIFEQEDISGYSMYVGLYETIHSFDFFDRFLARARQEKPEHVQALAGRMLDSRRCVIGWLSAESPAAGPAIAGLDEEEALPERDWQFRSKPAQHPRDMVRPEEGSRLGGISVSLPIETHRLDNGLVVLCCPIRQIPAVQLGAVVLAGSREDVPGGEGLAHLVSNLLDEGTARRDHLEIAGFVDGIGGTLDTFGTREASGVSLKVLKEDLLPFLDLLQELLYESVFPEDRLELVRSQSLSYLASLEDRPDYVGSREFCRLIYQGTPLEGPNHGYPETVRKLGREQLMEFYRRFFHPANTILMLVGDFEVDALLARVREKWGSLPPGPLFQRQPLALRRAQEPVAKTLRVADKEQAHLFLGHLGIRRNNPDFYSLLVLDVILGSGPGFTSRIPKILRDELGLAYHTYAAICASASLDEGRFVAYIGTSPANRAVARERMTGEIRRIRDEEVTSEELAAAKSYLTGSFVFNFENMHLVGNFMLNSWVYGLGFDYPQKFFHLVQSVTQADVKRVAREYLHPDGLTLVEVIPAKRKVAPPGSGS